MRDGDHPMFQAGRRLSEWIDEIAVPNDDPLGQLIWATVIRSGDTYASISHLIGHEFDTQAAMLCRPLFEDMVVAHWLSYNRDDSDWLIERFFRHREALALVQLDLERRYGWSFGAPLVPDPQRLKAQQNELLREFRGGVRNWWDPGKNGRGTGGDVTLGGVARILEEAAVKRERFDPRFAGGEEALLRRWDDVLNRWYAQQLHHTAIGLPFQPHPEGPVTFDSDDSIAFASFRVLFTAYWMYGQQIFLLYEHFGEDMTEYQRMFLEGLREQANVVGFEGQFHPYAPE